MLDVKYPCGLEVKSVRLGFAAMFMEGEIPIPNPSKCPMHGKECKRAQ